MNISGMARAISESSRLARGDLPAAECGLEAGGCPVQETPQRLSGEHEAPAQSYADRALAAVRDWQQRGIPSPLPAWVATALTAEIERVRADRRQWCDLATEAQNEAEQLRTEMAGDRELAQRERAAWMDAYRGAAADAERLRTEFEFRRTALESANATLSEQVQRLSRGGRDWYELAVTASADLARFRASLPGIIGCACGDGAACNRDAYGFGPCCATRLRMVKAGLIPAPDRATEEGEGT